MTLTTQELERLQKLASIELSPEEQDKLGSQLQSIVSFLDKLQEVKIDWVIWVDEHIDNPLRTLEGVVECEDTQALLDNVKHEKINNSVVIKSVLS